MIVFACCQKAPEHDVWQFMLFLDDVRTDNGAIKFWPNSTTRLIDETHPRKSVEGLAEEIPEADAGELFVWHARTIHQSLPNKTNKRRLGLSWYVTTETVIERVN